MSQTTKAQPLKRVLVTGAASGIGRAIARSLVEDSVAVVLTDKDEPTLARTAKELARGKAPVLALPADLLDPASVDAMAARAFAEGGPVDGLVNCAGIYPVTRFLDLSVEEWDAVMGVNVRGLFLVTQSVVRRMVGSKTGGAIVNISSTASRTGRPGITHYGASKAAVNQITRVLAVELAPHGIRVNAVLPGVIATERVMEMSNAPQGRAESEAKLKRIPMGRFGEPEEIVAMVRFLLSPAASYATGGLFVADGGFSLGLPASAY
ncbi:MAG: SDR family oxidoreductase [Alphaproteobacteria bacterium]|nr:SDR family oxidoreductase [Alphaproteobacteria bacterium]